MSVACDDWDGPCAQILFFLLKFMMIHTSADYLFTYLEKFFWEISHDQMVTDDVGKN